jgi:NTP pyrophosphatase (non-canonical NTP hydrolase)
MFTKEFLEFIDAQDEYISRVYGSADTEKQLLARTVKLSEEAGEVSDAVLAHINNQRKEKLDKCRDLGGELADVIIVCALIAKTAGIDISEALEEKTKKIQQRRYEHIESKD